MKKRFRGQELTSGIYGPDEPMESLAPERIEGFNPSQFGSMPPDEGVFKQFSLGPWHELRRQMMLFAVHVRPLDGKEISPRRDPGKEIDERCDVWIMLFLKAVDELKILLPPPKDLRKWLHVRAMMALSFIDFEIRNQEKKPAPDLKKKFQVEVGTRLVIFWEEQGKKRWIENDPNKPSSA